MKAKTTGKNMHCQGYFSSAIVKQVMFAMRKRVLLFSHSETGYVCYAKDSQNNRQEHALSRLLKLAIVKLAVCSVQMVDKENMLSRVLWFSHYETGFVVNCCADEQPNSHGEHVLSRSSLDG